MRMPFLFALLVCGAGCRNFEGTAVEAFSKERSCLQDGVTAHVRDDVGAYQLQFPTPVLPPADIANDPSRRAVWEADQEKMRSGFNSRQRVYEVNGCNENWLVSCGYTTLKIQVCMLIKKT
jgi:hypothetical protein